MNNLLLFFTFIFLNGATETENLTVTITNIKEIRGSIEIGLFNSGERFLEAGQAYRSISIEVTKDSETVVIKDLPKDTYAISLYHDQNSNGKCDRNLVGIPKEPYAFSNNFRPRFSAPSFEDCEFELVSDHAVQIELIH